MFFPHRSSFQARVGLGGGGGLQKQGQSIRSREKDAWSTLLPETQEQSGVYTRWLPVWGGGGCCFAALRDWGIEQVGWEMGQQGPQLERAEALDAGTAAAQPVSDSPDAVAPPRPACELLV